MGEVLHRVIGDVADAVDDLSLLVLDHEPAMIVVARLTRGTNHLESFVAFCVHLTP